MESYVKILKLKFCVVGQGCLQSQDMSPDNTEHACVKKKVAVENEVTSESNEGQGIGTLATPFTTPLDIDCTGQLLEQKDDDRESVDLDSTTPKEYCIPAADQQTAGRNCIYTSTPHFLTTKCFPVV